MSELSAPVTEHPESDTPAGQGSRFRWQVLLLFPLLAILVLGYIAWGQQGQQRAIADLKANGAIVRTEPVPVPFFEQIAGSDFSQRVIEVYWVGRDVTQNNLAALAGVGTLRKLELTNSTIDSEGLQHLDGLRDLYALHLSGTNAGDDALPHVGRLQSLEILSLNETGITDTGLARISHLPRLERLFLNATRITDAGLEHLAGMTQLKELSLKNLPITDAGISQLKTLVNLEILALDNNPNLTPQGILALRETIPRLVFSLDEQDPTNPLVKSQ